MIPALSGWVALAQSDTTVGLLSQEAAGLNRLKGRRVDQPLIVTVCDFGMLRGWLRTPTGSRSRIRRMRRTTIAYPQRVAIRVVSGDHARMLERIGWCFSSSANPTGGAFDENWAKEQANLWCLSLEGFKSKPASKILRLTKGGRFVKLR